MYFSINDATYWYELHGKGPAVVLLHGFTGSSTTWNPFIRSFAPSFQVITIDLPGHGKTNMKTPWSMEACCKDLRDLFTYLGLTKIHLVGYSMGGRTALSFAMLYPEYVQSIVLESASPGLETEEERNARIVHDEKLAEKVEQEGVTSFVDFWEDVPLFQTQKKLPLEVRQIIRDERLAQTAPGLAGSLRYMGTGSQPSWWELLSTVSIPVLLMVGALDEKFLRINQRMIQHLKNPRFIEVENAGHAIHVEQSSFFGKMVMEFLLTTIRCQLHSNNTKGGE
ncbi:2-succinyl-6-hydroxy-2,4-cyclohexadiene-1-carboxylate synthase [Lentibacillus songyuanensis]|uniref:2-succinyl-6-hydroxy-2, 4-cyclohexadiene-1-carboxylate synthase n=1 Tax=Lentibacillus songyuanensis TaxID=3136161 RepID=UPI0031BAC0AC